MVKIQVSKQEYDVAPGITIEKFMTDNGLPPDAYLYLDGATPIPMDTPIEDGMNIRAIKVASGG